MDGYKAWLEKQIVEMKEFTENSVKSKCYGAADTYVTRANVYKQCLVMFNKATENKGIKFNDLEVCKKYVSVFEDGEVSSAFIVVCKGCDDRGDYILFYNVDTNSTSYKTYERDFNLVKYFKEVKE